MKRKKGFTLIELLAVIVILAIIALIATPMILNVIENAKKGAVESSANGYIEAIENQKLNDIINNGIELKDGVYDVPIKNVSIKGEPPKSGWVVIEKGQVVNYSFVINEYVASKGKKTVKGDTALTKPSGEEVTTLPSGLKIGTAVYVNPVTKTVCNELEAVSTTGTKTGCMKWYVYKDNGDSTYQLILDHNTTATVKYNSSNSNTSMDATITKEINDLVSVSGWKVTPRLITAEEVAAITGNIDFNATKGWFYLDSNNQIHTATTPGSSKYYWLYDNTYECTGGNPEYGCKVVDNNTYINMSDGTSSNSSGYWTSTALPDSPALLWFVFKNGSLYDINANSNFSGVRPVITF